MSNQVGPDEAALVMEFLDSGATINQAAFKFGRGPDTIRRIKRKFSSTTKLATRFIKAKALDMAEKVVEKGSIAELVDVLSRPNIGVLDPIQHGPQVGAIYMSMEEGSLGGVVITNQPATSPALDPVQDQPRFETVDQPSQLTTRKTKKKLLADPSKQVVESHPSRKAIFNPARGRNTTDRDSSIHLRYDIVEPDRSE